MDIHFVHEERVFGSFVGLMMVTMLFSFVQIQIIVNENWICIAQILKPLIQMNEYCTDFVVAITFQRQSCMAICDLWIGWFCYGCCCSQRKYADHFDLQLLGQHSSNEQMNETIMSASTTPTPISGVKTTVQISSAPDLHYLVDTEAVQSVSEPQLQIA